MPSLPVQTSSARYEVLIGSGLVDSLGGLIQERLARPARRAFLAYDSGLPAPWVARASRSLSAAGFKLHQAPLTASEAGKSLAQLETLLAAIAASKLERFEPIIALGGGIVGDLAGFAAASYRRGVPVIQCPTTLLSMVDASVGGKTGVNLDAGGSLKKNLVGAFHQPAVVVIDVDSLSSLSDRHLRAGLAECIKHGLISAGPGALSTDPELFAWTQARMPAFLARDPAALTELITRNVRVKAAVVGTDEREELPPEQGGRALLNLGHTFGHAIETIPHLSPDGSPAHAPLHHGEAVAVGLIAAAHAAHAAGMCSAEIPLTVTSAVASAGLPTRLAGLPPGDELLALMSHDKKVVGGKLRLVLPVGAAPGTSMVVENTPASDIVQAWQAVRGA
ncbi:MAG TPA: 3-dehydroquinate synthase family protein [Phycisphaerales bacterium]|nr:3-dehydroquinate synthase family protein [Phycisphaerales bacterium]